MQAVHSRVDLSVVICTFNGQDRLPEVLDALMVQSVPPEIHWEIVVIDNNSTDRTSEVATGYGPQSPAPLIVVKESTPGLIYARRRGLLVSTGQFISFLDDDTIVDADWVQAVCEFFRTHERAGLVGPKIMPKLDSEPPAYFDLIKHSLAIQDLGDETLELTSSKRWHPIGPSGCRRVAIEPCLLRDSFDVIGRCGSQLSSCEDSVLAFEVRRGGWQWWYEPKMRMQHHIPPHRLTEEYLRRLMEGLAGSVAQMKVAELGRPLSFAYVTGRLLAITAHYTYRTLTSLTGRTQAKRIFSRILKAYFRTAFVAYVNEYKRSKIRVIH